MVVVVSMLDIQIIETYIANQRTSHWSSFFRAVFLKWNCLVLICGFFHYYDLSIDMIHNVLAVCSLGNLESVTLFHMLSYLIFLLNGMFLIGLKMYYHSRAVILVII